MGNREFLDSIREFNKQAGPVTWGRRTQTYGPLDESTRGMPFRPCPHSTKPPATCLIAGSSTNEEFYVRQTPLTWRIC